MDTEPNKKNQKQLAISKILLVVLALIGLGLVVWVAWMRPSEKANGVTTYEECVAAGNPVQLSYPGVCSTPDGKRFTNPEQSVGP